MLGKNRRRWHRALSARFGVWGIPEDPSLWTSGRSRAAPSRVPNRVDPHIAHAHADIAQRGWRALNVRLLAPHAARCPHEGVQFAIRELYVAHNRTNAARRA